MLNLTIKKICISHKICEIIVKFELYNINAVHAAGMTIGQTTTRESFLKNCHQSQNIVNTFQISLN